MATKANKAARTKHFGEMSSHTRALQNVMNAASEKTSATPSFVHLPKSSKKWKALWPQFVFCATTSKEDHRRRPSDRARARGDVLGKDDLGLGDALRTAESLGRNLDLLQLHARQHQLEDDRRHERPEVDLVRVLRGAAFERLEEDPNGDPAIDVRIVIVLGLDPLLRPHEALAQQSLCSRELYGRRNVAADLRDNLDLGMVLLLQNLKPPWVENVSLKNHVAHNTKRASWATETRRNEQAGLPKHLFANR